MNSKDQADIPNRLKRLRKISAPASLEIYLHRRIRSLPHRNPFLSWFLRPMPVALAVAVGAFVVAAYFAVPYYLSTSSTLPGERPVRLPSGEQSTQLPDRNSSERARLQAPLAGDSLSSDSASVGKNDVNTSKLP